MSSVGGDPGWPSSMSEVSLLGVTGPFLGKHHWLWGRTESRGQGTTEPLLQRPSAGQGAHEGPILRARGEGLWCPRRGQPQLRGMEAGLAGGCGQGQEEAGK